MNADRLITMLCLTALLHAIVLLGVTFTSGAIVRNSPGMEVLLVTEELPDAKRNAGAAYAAQRSQLGSGNTKSGATSSPAMAVPQEEQHTPQSGDEALLHTNAATSVMRYLGDARTPTEQRADERAQTGAAAREARGEGAELVLRGDPKTGLWLSPDTYASELAPYLDRWRRRIERMGTLNYPTGAAGGSPVVEVALRSDGTLLEASVQRSSGYAALDQAALNILRLASPFSAFPADLAADYGVLRFAYQWQFERGHVVQGTVTAPTEATNNP
jgi:protein TonB